MGSKGRGASDGSSDVGIQFGGQVFCAADLAVYRSGMVTSAAKGPPDQVPQAPRSVLTTLGMKQRGPSQCCASSSPAWRATQATSAAHSTGLGATRSRLEGQA